MGKHSRKRASKITPSKNSSLSKAKHARTRRSDQRDIWTPVPTDELIQKPEEAQELPVDTEGADVTAGPDEEVLAAFDSLERMLDKEEHFDDGNAEADDAAEDDADDEPEEPIAEAELAEAADDDADEPGEEAADEDNADAAENDDNVADDDIDDDADDADDATTNTSEDDELSKQNSLKYKYPWLDGNDEQLDEAAALDTVGDFTEDWGEPDEPADAQDGDERPLNRREQEHERIEQLINGYANPDSAYADDEERPSERSRREREERAMERKAAGRTKHRRVKTVLLGILTAILAVVAVAFVGIAILVPGWLQDLPDYKSLESYDQTGITTIYANDRETVLAEITLANRIHVDGDQIDQKAKDALVATEDERFYEHGAVDPVGIARAVVVNITGGSMQGASTLTQQLVRNTILADEMTDRSLKRKIREAYIAIKLEEEYSKDELLATYLNVVNFGNGNYGIEAASRDYFGHSSDDLTLAEAAMLVGIPNSPTQYNPAENYDAAVGRMNTVLSRMLSNGYITQSEYDEAVANPPELVEVETTDKVSDIAPYFVDYIKQLIREQGEKYNIDSDSAIGYNIYTTLDVTDQNAANAAITAVLEDSDTLDGSLTAIDPENGYIVALVGGKDYSADNYSLATQMQRQPGSTFKPFTLIAAMQLGMSPDTRVNGSSPAKITDEWAVKNSGNASYGTINLYKATANSVNTAYARVAHEIGAQAIVDTAHALGIKSELAAVESVTLGTQGVNTLEMASAYATIAAGGIYHEPVAIMSIEDNEGNAVYETPEDPGIQVISPEVAYLATKAMEGVIEGGTATRAQLKNGQVAAGKTGTSEYGSDLWMCGFTPQLACAVWTGTRDNSETSLFGGTTSTPIWKKFMDVALEDEEVVPWDDIDVSEIIWRKDWSFNDIDKKEEAAAEKQRKQEEEAAKAAQEAIDAAKEAIANGTYYETYDDYYDDDDDAGTSTNNSSSSKKKTKKSSSGD